MLIADSAFSPTLGRVPKRRDTIEVLTRHHQDPTSNFLLLGQSLAENGNSLSTQDIGTSHWCVHSIILKSYPQGTNDFLLAVLPCVKEREYHNVLNVYRVRVSDPIPFASLDPSCQLFPAVHGCIPQR